MCIYIYVRVVRCIRARLEKRNDSLQKKSKQIGQNADQGRRREKKKEHATGKQSAWTTAFKNVRSSTKKGKRSGESRCDARKQDKKRRELNFKNHTVKQKDAASVSFQNTQETVWGG
jgi:protein subunit release factor B